MRTKPLAILLLGSALLAPAAMAQPQAPAANNSQQPLGSVDARPGDTGIVPQADAGILRASDLIGHDIFGTGNEDIGEIEDILFDRSGRIAAVIVEVEDVSGIDERTIAVPIQFVQINPIDTTATTGTIPGAGLPASTAEGQQVRQESRISRVLVPDRIVLTMPVDQLRSAPEFDDND